MIRVLITVIILGLVWAAMGDGKWVGRYIYDHHYHTP